MENSELSHMEGDWVTSPDLIRRALLTLIVGELVFFVVLKLTLPTQQLRSFAPLATIVLALVAWRVLVVKGAEAAKRVMGVGGLVLTLLVCYLVAGVLTPSIIALPVLLSVAPRRRCSSVRT